LCVGSYTTADDLPADFELADAIGKTGSEPLLTGGAGIIGPDGSWLAGPVDGRETIVYAELDLGRIAEEQQALDSAGHYNPPDVFRLTVDERPQPQVDWLRSEPALERADSF